MPTLSIWSSSTGATVVVPLVRASCGVMGARMRLACPLCSQRICTLYHLHSRVRVGVVMASGMPAQRTSRYGRKALTTRKIRRKLGDPPVIETVPGAGYRLYC